MNAYIRTIIHVCNVLQSQNRIFLYITTMELCPINLNLDVIADDLSGQAVVQLPLRIVCDGIELLQHLEQHWAGFRGRADDLLDDEPVEHVYVLLYARVLGGYVRDGDVVSHLVDLVVGHHDPLWPVRKPVGITTCWC